MNPWEMNWQTESAPAAAATAPKPWEMNWTADPVEAAFPEPPRLDRDKLAQAFRGDPLAALTPERRATVSNWLNLQQNPEQEAKRQALSLFVADKFHLDPSTAGLNLQHFLDVYTNEKNISVDKAYQRVGEILNPKPAETVAPEMKAFAAARGNMGGDKQQPDPLTGWSTRGGGGFVKPQAGPSADAKPGALAKLGGALESGVYQLGSMNQGFTSGVNDLVNNKYSPTHAIPHGLLEIGSWLAAKIGQPELSAKLLGASDYLDKDYQASRGNMVEFKRKMDDLSAAVDQKYSNGKDFVTTWTEDGAAAFGEKLVYEGMKQMPQTMLQLALYRFSPHAALGWLGTSSKGQRDLDVVDDPNMTDKQKAVNATLYSIAEVVPEYLLGSFPLMEKIFAGPSRELFKQGLLRGTARLGKEVGEGFAQEGFTEALTQGLQNATDLYTGKDGVDYRTMTVKEQAAFIRRGMFDAFMIGGSTGGVLGGFAHVGYNQAHSYADVDQARARVRSAVETEIETLRAADDLSDRDTADLRRLEKFAKSGDMDTAYQWLVNRDMARMVQLDEIGMDESALRLEGRREWQERAGDNWTPDDTAAAVAEAAQAFPSVTVQTVPTASALPENVIGRIPEEQRAKVRGLFDESANTVYVVGDMVRPDEVGPVLLHEAAAHYGLRQAFGQRLDPLLDALYKSRRDEIDAFNSDRNLGFFMADEAGSRAASEEWLAVTAETMQGQPRPAWWREILFNCKQFLRRVPGFRNMRFTDREIEDILVASGKAARKGGAVQTGGDDVMLAAAAALRRPGAPNTADQPGQLRDSKVPYNLDALNAAGFDDAYGLYGDYEFLYGKHPEYFKSPAETKAVAEFVLDDPVPAKDINENAAFMRRDETGGKFYRVEVSRKVKGKRYHIRSVHEITEVQYQKNKSAIAESAEADRSYRNVNDSRKGLTLADYYREDNADSGNVKLSLASLPRGDIRSLAKILLPDVSGGKISSGEEAFKYLHEVEQLTSIDRNEAGLAFGEARFMIKERKKLLENNEFDRWMRDLNPIPFRIDQELGVKKIKPDAKFGKRKDFKGSWVDFKNGMPSDEAANLLGVTEEELVDAIRGKTRRALREEFRDWRKEQSGDAYWDELAASEFRRESEQVIDDVLDGKRELTPELRQQYPELEAEVYRRITGEEGNPPENFDWSAASAALRHAEGGVSDYMQGVKFGRDEAAAEYTRLLDRLKAERADLVASQKLLKDYALRMLPPGERDAVLKKITALASADTKPTKKYPHGERQAMLENIMNMIRDQREIINRRDLRARIAERLQQTTIKRGPNGKPAGKYTADEQAMLDRIRAVTQMSPGRVWSDMEALQDQAEQLEGAGQDNTAVLEELGLRQRFGNLDYKTSNELEAALSEIQRLAYTGRMQLQRELQERRNRIEQERETMINDVSGGKGLLSPQEERQLQQRRAGQQWAELGKHFWRNNLNFEWTMDHITRYSGKTLGDTLAGRYVKAVHRAGQVELTGRRERSAAFDAEFDRIFGTNGVISRGRVYQRLRQLEEHTNIYRNQRPAGTGKGLEYERLTVDDARQMLRDHDERTARLPEFEAEAIRHQLADFDAGERGKAAGFRFGDDFTDDVMARMQEENKTGYVAIPRIKDPGPMVEEALTQAQALQLWLCWGQDNVRYKMMFNGWSEESARQLEKFLDPKVKELGEWMREELAADYPKINEVFSKMYYANMPNTPGYWPTSYNVNSGGVKEDTKDTFGMPYGMAAVSPGALKSRRFHTLEPKAADAFSVYASHVVQMEHFKALAPVIRDLRGVFNNADVAAAVKQQRGDRAYSDLVNAITWIADGGRRDAMKISLLDKMYSPWVASKLLFNVQSAAKQLAGVAAYMNDIPVSAFARGTAEFWRNPRENARMLMNTDYFKNRWAGSMDRDLNMLLDWSSSVAGKQTGWMRELVQNGAILNKAGDALSVVCGGYAVYKYHYDNLIKRGVGHEQAHEQALLEWEMSSNRTQQSGQVSDMNSFQLGGSLSRMLTTYLSNPILVMQAQVETTLDALHGRGVDSWSKAGRMIFINHVVVPSLMVGVMQMLKHREKLDEYEFSEFLMAGLMGPFEGLFLFGKGLNGLAAAAMGGWERGASVLPLADDVARAFKQMRKVAKDGFDPEPGEIINAVANTGAALTPVSNSAAVIGAVGREARRWWRIFTGDTGKKKKQNTLKLGGN